MSFGVSPGSFVAMLCPDVHDDDAVGRVGRLWMILAQLDPPSLQPVATASRELFDALHCIVMAMNGYGLPPPTGFPAVGDLFFGITFDPFDDA